MGDSPWLIRELEDESFPSATTQNFAQLRWVAQEPEQTPRIRFPILRHSVNKINNLDGKFSCNITKNLTALRFSGDEFSDTSDRDLREFGDEGKVGYWGVLPGGTLGP